MTLKKIFFLAICLCCALWLTGCSGGKPERTKLKIGDPAPDFSVVDIDGKPVSLSGYKGYPVIMRFWSTDCKYCRADTPIFNHYFNKYREKGLRVVYINKDADEATVRSFVENLEIIFPVVRDTDGSLAASYNIRIEPQTIVLSPEHTIVAAILGGVSETELQALLGEYLGTGSKAAPLTRKTEE